MTRDLGVAQHEAAHVVVGTALGLRLRKATARRSKEAYGYADFDLHFGTLEATAIMYAAGVAWERYVTGSERLAYGDKLALRKMGFRSRASMQPLVVSAWSILSARSGAHARITRALAERDLRGGDLAAFVRGERLDDG